MPRAFCKHSKTLIASLIAYFEAERGKRLIILHAGNTKGFIKGAELIFPSGTNSADYHGEMNRANFLYWFENQLILNLEEPSVIVMDNASYHSTILNKSPTTASTKAEIQQWLDNNNIPYDVNLLKIQLLDLVRRHNAPVVFEIDELAQKYGHMILRLPPYHCIFNPIENIWGIAKNYYVRHVEAGGKTLENSKAIWKDALNSITANVWANTIAHTEKEIQKWWNREIGMDHRDVEEFIINLGEDSSDESVESS